MKHHSVSPRLRNREFRAASLAVVFMLQILSLCLCLPAAAEEHDCCPPTSQPELPDALGVANPSTQAATACCPDGPAMRAVLRISEPEVTASLNMHAAFVPAWIARSHVPAQPHHTGSVLAERESPARRSPILRI